MRKNIFLASIFSLAIFLALILVFGLLEKKSLEEPETTSLDKVEKVENLLNNSSFEKELSELKDWQLKIIGNTSAGFDPIIKWEGDFSFGMASGDENSVAFLYQCVKDIEADKKLSLLGFIKTQACDSARFELELYYKDSLLICGYSDAAKQTTDWEEYNAWVKAYLPYSLEPPELKVIVKCIVYGKGSAWFDKVRLYSIPLDESIYDLRSYLK